MSMMKNEFINSLNNNQSTEGMTLLNINELDDINNIIGAQLGFEMAKLKPDASKMLKYQTLMGKIVIMKTELKHTESNQ
tara:strand:+ start:1341 stop:1577 length:237 start_codon:yes stop_codon:yes gene_type:complete